VRWVSGCDRGAADSGFQIACALLRQIARALVRNRCPAKHAAHAPRQNISNTLETRSTCAETKAAIQKALPASAT